MKHRMTLSLVLTLSVLLSLVSLPSTAQAAPLRFRADSGFVTLMATEILRITVVGTGNEMIKVRLRWMQYGAPVCSGMPAVCRHTVASEGAPPAETLDPDAALSFEFRGTGDAVRVVVEINSPNARVRGVVFDTSTWRITATLETGLLQL